MKKYKGEYILRLTEQQMKKLDELHKKTKKPKAYFVRLAIDILLRKAEKILQLEEEYEKKLSELALERLNDKSDEILTIEEFERELGITK